MNSPAANPAAVSVDRVRMIRRSIRCCIFGALGVVPVFGLPLGYLAMRLSRQVAEETGDRWSLKTLNGVWAAGLFVLAVVLFRGLWAVAGLLGMALLATHFILLAKLARRVQAREWNPARHLVYWGVALAYAGRALSAAFGVAVFAIIAGRLLGL